MFKGIDNACNSAKIFWIKWFSERSQNTIETARGRFKILSREGGFKKKILYFFRSILGQPNWFSEFSQFIINTYFMLTQFSAQQANFWKRGVLGTFLRILSEKWIFWRALPSKLINIGTEGAFRRILGSVSQKWISAKKVSKKRGLLGRQGVESVRRGRPNIPLICSSAFSTQLLDSPVARNTPLITAHNTHGMLSLYLYYRSINAFRLKWISLNQPEYEGKLSWIFYIHLIYRRKLLKQRVEQNRVAKHYLWPLRLERTKSISKVDTSDLFYF